MRNIHIHQRRIQRNRTAGILRRSKALERPTRDADTVKIQLDLAVRAPCCCKAHELQMWDRRIPNQRTSYQGCDTAPIYSKVPHGDNAFGGCSNVFKIGQRPTPWILNILWLKTNKRLSN